MTGSKLILISLALFSAVFNNSKRLNSMRKNYCKMDYFFMQARFLNKLFVLWYIFHIKMIVFVIIITFFLKFKNIIEDAQTYVFIRVFPAYSWFAVRWAFDDVILIKYHVFCLDIYIFYWKIKHFLCFSNNYHNWSIKAKDSKKNDKNISNCTHKIDNYKISFID